MDRACHYNLGQIKIEKLTPPLKVNDEFARKAKRTIFPSVKWEGGGGGGLNFSFHLSKIVDLLTHDCSVHVTEAYTWQKRTWQKRTHV